MTCFSMLDVGNIFALQLRYMIRRGDIVFSIPCFILNLPYNQYKKYSLIIAIFTSMYTFQRRFTITPLAITRPEHSSTISDSWRLYR